MEGRSYRNHTKAVYAFDIAHRCQKEGDEPAGFDKSQQIVVASSETDSVSSLAQRARVLSLDGSSSPIESTWSWVLPIDDEQATEYHVGLFRCVIPSGNQQLQGQGGWLLVSCSPHYRPRMDLRGAYPHG